MLDALRFLLVVEVIGLAAVPLAATVLGRLPGSGLAFAKPLGLLAAAYPVWLLVSARIVPWSTGAAVAGVLALAVGGGTLWWRAGRPVPRGLDRRLLIAGEALFAAAFLGGALLGGYSADIRGTEKPMDMAILAAIDAGDEFPPHDPWLAGESLNYYYLGHYLMAFVVRLSGVDPSVGYNLALALSFALAAVAAFALAATLTAAAGGRRPVLIGLTGAALVCLAGNLDSAARLFESPTLAEYDWFASSRVVPDTINEFTGFSWVLGDLHAHVLAVPFTLLAFGFGLQVALRGPRWAELAPAGIAVGTLYAINAWSYPLAAGIVAAGAAVWLRDPARVTSWRRAAIWAGGVVGVSVLAVLPFLLAYEPTPRGIGIVGERRSLPQFLGDQALMIGAFAWVLVAAYAQRLLATARPWRTAALCAATAVVVGGLLAIWDLAGVALLVAGLVIAVRTALERALAAERFGWLLIAAGVACLLVPEVLYVRDEFDGGPLFRMNTVFKLGYQAWIVLAVMAACVLPWGRRWLPLPAWRLWAPVALVLIAVTALFPFAGRYARTGGFGDGPRLAGDRWLDPGDRVAIAWLRENAAGDAVVLEAVGPDYSEFGHARISTFSGRPAVLGWAGHELQWGHDPGDRAAEVERLYRGVDPEEARFTLARYGVDYVVSGPLERADYGDDGVGKFDVLGERVLDRDGTTVWRVGPRGPSVPSP